MGKGDAPAKQRRGCRRLWPKRPMVSRRVGGGGSDALPVSALSWRVVTGILESGNGNQVGAGTQLCAATAVRLAKWNTHVCNGDFRIFCVAPLNRTFHATSTVLK